jgi:hypothetical protein
MTLIVILDLIAVGMLCVSVFRHGYEESLPVLAFLLILFPNASQLPIPFFDLTTQRVLIIAACVLYLFRVGQEKTTSNTQSQLPLKALILCQIAWMIASTADSAVFTVSLKTVLSQSFDYYLTYYLFAKRITQARTVHRIIWAVVMAMALCAVFGAIEAYQGWSVLSLFPSGFSGIETDRGVRVQSTFSHAILFGGALAMVIPLAFYLLPTARSAFQRGFLWVAVMIMFLNIYKTGSRGPWLALIASLVALFVFGQGHLKKTVMATCMLCLIVLIVRPGVWESLYNTYAATSDSDSPQGESYQWRYALYRVAIEQVNKDVGRALWGYGPESFAYLGLTTQFPVDGEMKTVRVESCDSSIAQLMIETGYIGLLLVLVMLSKAAMTVFRNSRRFVGVPSSLGLVLFVNICAFAFLMTNVAILGWGQQNYILWILIALSMTYAQSVQHETAGHRENSREPLTQQFATNPS